MFLKNYVLGCICKYGYWQGEAWADLGQKWPSFTRDLTSRPGADPRRTGNADHRVWWVLPGLWGSAGQSRYHIFDGLLLSYLNF